mmetsp:Transcript_11685/g.21556  ORF Transcript_11685/g.21556 Transcript_11685/m.21556 type:complete len:488 (+) Transcript_11685:208-1671(+)
MYAVRTMSRRPLPPPPPLGFGFYEECYDQGEDDNDNNNLDLDSGQPPLPADTHESIDEGIASLLFATLDDDQSDSDSGSGRIPQTSLSAGGTSSRTPSSSGTDCETLSLRARAVSTHSTSSTTTATVTSASAGARNASDPTTSNNNSSSSNSNNSDNNELLFPRKLHGMLHDAKALGFEDIVSWGKDSHQAFKVHKKRDFERFILPKYFKMTKYKSFTRQLHNYEFVWVRNGNDKGGYRHAAFDRNHQESCDQINRRTSLNDPPLYAQQQKQQDSNPKASTSSRKRARSEESLQNAVATTNGIGTATIPSIATSRPSPQDQQTRYTSAVMFSNHGHPQEASAGYPNSMNLVEFYEQQEQQRLASRDMAMTTTAAADPHRRRSSAGIPQPPLLESSTAPQLLVTPSGMYAREEKLPLQFLPSATATNTTAPVPHPLEQFLEPRTIEEMIQFPNGMDGNETEEDYDEMNKKQKATPPTLFTNKKSNLNK